MPSGKTARKTSPRNRSPNVDNEGPYTRLSVGAGGGAGAAMIQRLIALEEQNEKRRDSSRLKTNSKLKEGSRLTNSKLKKIKEEKRKKRE